MVTSEGLSIVQLDQVEECGAEEILATEIQQNLPPLTQK
jgi:hypothetical protein